jgi:hypothetical protein
VEVPERFICGSPEHAVGEDGVVQIEEQPGKAACFVALELGERLQRGSIRAMSALRYKPSENAAGTG